jgi:hypothetical protein
VSTPDYDALIESLVRELLPLARRSAEAWEDRAVTSAIPAALEKTGNPQQFLDWASDHRRWRFALAEAQEADGEACAKPMEAAVLVMKTILEERFDELGL